METIQRTSFGGKPVALFKKKLDNGKIGYGVEIDWSEEEKILFDHWNLGALKRQITEWFPAMKMARESR